MYEPKEEKYKNGKKGEIMPQSLLQWSEKCRKINVGGWHDNKVDNDDENNFLINS